MNRLKDIHAVFECEDVSKQEKEFARMQGMGKLLGELHRGGQENVSNVNKTSSGPNIGINSGNLVQDKLRVAENILHLYDLVTKSHEGFKSDFQVSQNKNNPNFSSLSTSLSSREFLVECLGTISTLDGARSNKARKKGITTEYQ